MRIMEILNSVKKNEKLKEVVIEEKVGIKVMKSIQGRGDKERYLQQCREFIDFVREFDVNERMEGQIRREISGAVRVVKSFAE